MIFELTLLGTNAALPTVGRNPSAQVLQVQHRYYLIDCGEGTQVRLLEYNVRHSRINQIFISHLHGDHVYGLIGLMTTWHLGGRREPLDIYAPEGLERMIRVQLEQSRSILGYPANFHVVDTDRHQCIYTDKCVEVWSLPLEHRIPTAGYLFREHPRPANILPEQIEAYNIPVAEIPDIKRGGDFTLPDGRRIPHEELTRPAPPPRSYAYCSDTRYLPGLADRLRGVDLLYHESTFLDADADRAAETLHTTARQAAELARAAGAGKLVLGHYSTRYNDISAFAEEARAVFPDTIAGEDGMCVSVPLSGRDK